MFDLLRLALGRYRIPDASPSYRPVLRLKNVVEAEYERVINIIRSTVEAIKIRRGIVFVDRIVSRLSPSRSEPFDEQVASVGNGVMIALDAGTSEDVDKV